MKTINVIILILTASIAFAQPNKGECKHQEQIKAQKVAYLTTKLDLSVQEAQVFWPVFNEYEKKKDDLFTAESNIAQKMTTSENLSDKEISEMTDKYIELQTAEAKLIAEYYLKFKKVLPPRKVMILYTSNRMFKRELLKQLRNCPAQKDQ